MKSQPTPNRAEKEKHILYLLQERRSTRIPDLHCPIRGGGGKALAIRRPRYRIQHNSLPMKVKDVGAISRIPHLHCPILACGGDALAIRRPRYRSHPIGMPMIGKDMAAISRIPHL